MPATLPIQIGERTVTVRELTVREVRDWLTSLEKGSATVDAGGEFVWEDCSLQDLARMSDCPVEAFDDFAPSDLAPLKQAARDLNPHGGVDVCLSNSFGFGGQNDTICVRKFRA